MQLLQQCRSMCNVNKSKIFDQIIKLSNYQIIKLSNYQIIYIFRVRVSWGRVENFKCVDYFQIEYFQKADMASTVKVYKLWNYYKIFYLNTY